MNCWFNIATKIAKSTEPQSKGFAIDNLHACPADNGGVYLTATDRHHAAVNLVDGELDKPRFVPSLVATHTGKKPMRVECNGQWQNDKGKFAPVVTEGHFPRLSYLMQSVDEQNCTLLVIDAAILKRLADSICGEKSVVKLILPAPDKDGVITSCIAATASGGFGIIMPCDDGGGARGVAAEYNAQAGAYVKSFALVEHDG